MTFVRKKIPTSEEQYEKIVNQFISKMEDVAAPFEDFVKGMQHAKETVDDRLSMAKNELKEQSDTWNEMKGKS